jgi:ketosteroid isomerase-like protein
LYEEYAQGDMSRTDLFDPAVETRIFGWVERSGQRQGADRGREELREWLGAWQRPLLIEADAFIESGDRILVLVRWKGTGKGSGVEMEAEGAHLLTFRDGLAVRFDVYRDREAARQALDRA